MNSFLSCLGLPTKQSSPLERETQHARAARKQREAVITALALVVIATLLVATCVALAHISLMPPEKLMGMGIFLYLPAVWLGILGTGVAVGAAVCTAIAVYRTYQKSAWATALPKAAVA